MFSKSFFVFLSFIVVFSLSVCYGDDNVLENPGFESGTTGWTGRGCSINTVTSPVYYGSRSGHAYDRDGTWQGIKQDMVDKMVPGETYLVSVLVRIGGASSSDTVTVSFEQQDGGGTAYHNIDSDTATDSGWIELSGNFTLTVTGTLGVLDFYVEGPAADVDIYVDQAEVYGPEPGSTDPYAEGTINVNTRYQEIEGFGAAGAWYEGMLTNHPQKTTLYNILFGQLSLDIYRVRNVYDQDNDIYMTRSGQIIAAGESSLGRPLKIMISSWSPKGSLKSNGDTTGYNGTLDKVGGEYVYEDFADWWADSLAAWSSIYGVDSDYINMQNEPDFSPQPPNEWDSCRFEPTETTTFAGYDEAFEEVYSEIYSRMGSGMPKMLAAEAAGIPNSYDYLDNLINPSHVYGYAHHLYNINQGQNPDAYIGSMADFADYASTHGNKPLFQTEYEDSTGGWPDAMNLALLLHNSLTVEGVVGYLYWGLFWGNSGGLVTLTSSSYTINSDYYGFKHYSAFIHSDWERVDATDDSTALRMSAYISPNNQQLSVVIINKSTDTDIETDLSFTGFSIDSGQVYRTSQTQNCVNIGSYDGTGSLTIPAETITTLSLTSSGGDITPPAAPTGLVATAGNETVSLDWNDNSEPDLAGYNVYRSTTSGGDPVPYVKLNGPLVTISEHDDDTVTNGIPYFYVVKAVDESSNESDPSNEDSATPDYQNCSDVQAGDDGLLSDLDGDCYVDYWDLEKIVYYWLEMDCSTFSDCDGADFEPDDDVDFADFSTFGLQWLHCNNPEDASCTKNW